MREQANERSEEGEREREKEEIKALFFMAVRVILSLSLSLSLPLFTMREECCPYRARFVSSSSSSTCSSFIITVRELRICRFYYHDDRTIWMELTEIKSAVDVCMINVSSCGDCFLTSAED